MGSGTGNYYGAIVAAFKPSSAPTPTPTPKPTPTPVPTPTPGPSFSGTYTINEYTCTITVSDGVVSGTCT
jgi:hypothetical protein